MPSTTLIAKSKMRDTSFYGVNLKKGYHSIRSKMRFFKFGYWLVLNLGYRLKWLRIYSIPIVINNFNRLTFLLQQIRFLEGCGFTNIVIVDNNSTYPPLLKFYESCKYTVIRERTNYGHLAFWKSGLYNKYKWNYFVYTDSDVVPVEECPKNFIEYFKSVLDENYHLDKVGFGIKIDDLPDSFALKEIIINHERRFWETEVAPGIYRAQIDTTFALYKPFSDLRFGEASTQPAYRLGYRYLIRHLPWYTDSQNLSEEEKFYLQTSNNSSSIAKQYKTGDVY